MKTLSSMLLFSAAVLLAACQSPTSSKKEAVPAVTDFNASVTYGVNTVKADSSLRGGAYSTQWQGPVLDTRSDPSHQGPVDVYIGIGANVLPLGTTDFGGIDPPRVYVIVEVFRNSTSSSPSWAMYSTYSDDVSNPTYYPPLSGTIQVGANPYSPNYHISYVPPNTDPMDVAPVDIVADGIGLVKVNDSEGGTGDWPDHAVLNHASFEYTPAH